MVVAIQLTFVVNYYVDKHRCPVQPLKLRQFLEVEYHNQTVLAELTPLSPCMKLDNKNFPKKKGSENCKLSEKRSDEERWFMTFCNVSS